MSLLQESRLKTFSLGVHALHGIFLQHSKEINTNRANVTKIRPNNSSDEEQNLIYLFSRLTASFLLLVYLTTV
jgi:hypothetical protein